MKRKSKSGRQGWAKLRERLGALRTGKSLSLACPASGTRLICAMIGNAALRSPPTNPIHGKRYSVRTVGTRIFITRIA